MIWLLIFWVCVFLLFHSYVLYPLLLNFLARNKKINKLIFPHDKEQLPHISILLAVYNEEKVIRQKIESAFNTDYPVDKIEFLIGSDGSTDQTNTIIKALQSKYPQIKLIEFSGRKGKAGIINELTSQASSDIFILTDANVFFRRSTIYHLIKHFKNPAIAVVGGNIFNLRYKKDGISYQEKSYISRENKMKFKEGIIWGTMIGAFGGCFAIRRSYYAKVPPKYIVDDFYITMSALSKGGKAINELDAICDEDVSNKVSEEFRRKVRISKGSFQTLVRFSNIFTKPFSGLAFSFFSHKVLRWIGPFFLAGAFISNLALLEQNFFYMVSFLAQILMFISPAIDSILKMTQIHISFVRFVSYFVMMNIALMVGFFRFLKGVDSNIWTPTQRNQ